MKSTFCWRLWCKDNVINYISDDLLHMDFGTFSFCYKMFSNTYENLSIWSDNCEMLPTIVISSMVNPMMKSM